MRVIRLSVLWMCLLVVATMCHGASKPEYCSKFIPASTGCDLSSWLGVFSDLFSPDDKACPHSLRYIDMDWRKTKKLAVYSKQGVHVSASGTGTDCTEKWGKRFNRTTEVDPIISPTSDNPCKGTVSFLTKVPHDAPARKYAEAGALNFTLTLGCIGDTSCERPVIKWNGMYNGKGGPWPNSQGNGVQVPPSSCNNFWQLANVTNGSNGSIS